MTTPDFVETWNRFQWRWIVWWGYSLALLELADVVLRWRGVHTSSSSPRPRAGSPSAGSPRGPSS